MKNDPCSDFWEEVEKGLKGEMTTRQMQMYKVFCSIDPRAGRLFLYGMLANGAAYNDLEIAPVLVESASEMASELHRLTLSPDERTSVQSLITSIGIQVPAEPIN